tara:strand:- start:5652 stop:6944 length:1293 start_codon:yes stop_codon:yes gene_type:complete
MISDKLNAVFQFVDFLHFNIDKFKSYIPTVEECLNISNEMETLNPNENFNDKIKYRKLTKVRNETFQNVFNNVTESITGKAEKLGIYQRTNTDFEFNWGYNEIQELKDNASENDLSFILSHKDKYLEFKNQVNSNFLSLAFFFSKLHEYLKEIFVFFDQDAAVKFDSLKQEEIRENNITEAVNSFKDDKSKSAKIHIDSTSPKEETKRILKFLNLIEFFEVRNIEKIYDEHYGKKIDTNRPINLTLENWNDLKDKFVKQRFERENYKDLMENETVVFELEILDLLDRYIKSDEAKLSADDYKTYKALIMRYRAHLQAKQSTINPLIVKNKIELVITLSDLIAHKKSVHLVDNIKIKYKNIKGKRLKLLFIAFQNLELLPKERIASKFHRCCKSEFDWDIASYSAMNDYQYNAIVDKAEIDSMKEYLKTLT